MALGLIYYGYFDSRISGTECKVEILKEGFAGASSEIIYNDLEACVISHEGDKEGIESVVFGSKLTYRFYATAADANKYDALFESNHKEVVIKYFEDSVLQWIGYLDPAGLQREFLESTYLIQLTANDGIADLKNEEFLTSGGAQYTDRVSILTVIRRCLDKRGADLALDFRIQLNTYESALGSATSCALAENSIDCRRFTKTRDGITTNEDCYHVLNEVLRPFNVVMRQSAGHMWIRQKHELNSYVYAYTSGGTYQSRTASNLVQSIFTSKFIPRQNSLSKYRPHHKALVTFQNRNLGENIITNPGFDDGLTAWNNGTAPDDFDGFGVVGGELSAWEPDAYLNAAGTEKWFQTNTFSVTKYSDNDYLKFRFKARIEELSYTSGDEVNNPLQVHIQCVYPSGTPVSSAMKILKREWTVFENADTVFPITSTGNYRLRIGIKQHAGATYSSYDVRFDDFEGLTNYESDDITFDKVIEVINNSPTAKAIAESTIYFGDTLQANDIGAIKDGANLTSKWNLYGQTNQKPLLELYGMQLLVDRKIWKNVMRLSIIDEANAIKPHEVLQYDSREYDHYSWDKNCVSDVLTVSLIEVLSEAISYGTLVYNKTTVDGA